MTRGFCVQVEELPVWPSGRCLVMAADAPSHPEEYMAVLREAVGTPGAGRPVHVGDRTQVIHLFPHAVVLCE